MIQIVAARYNEDVEWLKNSREDTIIYNKGDTLHYFTNIISLPNIGREAHTYLYHIVNNYHNLAEVTLFTQARVSDHGYIEDIDSLKDTLGATALMNGFSSNISKYNIGDDTSWDPYFNVKVRTNLIEYYRISAESVDKIIFKDWFEKYIYHQYPEVLHAYPCAIFAVSKKQILSRSIDYYKILLSQLLNENSPIEAHFLERSWYYVFNCHKVSKSEDVFN
jgi:hypothetical protein